MYIYKTTNHINNKIYIGLKTIAVEDSVNYYGSGTLLRYAIKKYGIDNFSKEILERDIVSMDVLNEREIYWIAEYSSTDKSIGYNLTDGGGGTKGMTPPNKGIPISAEALAKRIGKKKTPAHVANIQASRTKTMSNRTYRTYITSDETKAKLKLAYWTRRNGFVSSGPIL